MTHLPIKGRDRTIVAFVVEVESDVCTIRLVSSFKSVSFVVYSDTFFYEITQTWS